MNIQNIKILYAYLAGALDSDGYITIGKTYPSRTRKDGRKQDYYTAQVGFNQIKPIIVNLFHKTFDGYKFTQQPKNPKHKLWYVWRVTNKQAVNVVKQLLPYLLLKKGQAELLILFDKLGKSNFDKKHELLVKIMSINNPKNRRSHYVQEMGGKGGDGAGGDLLNGVKIQGYPEYK